MTNTFSESVTYTWAIVYLEESKYSAAPFIAVPIEHGSDLHALGSLEESDRFKNRVVSIGDECVLLKAFMFLHLEYHRVLDDVVKLLNLFYMYARFALPERDGEASLQPLPMYALCAAMFLPVTAPAAVVFAKLCTEDAAYMQSLDARFEDVDGVIYFGPDPATLGKEAYE